ncbi:polyphosphate kinase 1 [Apilactobacillus kunkeei]|uniref:Polyphosphate kinase n=1 Tax=Apilactobacillus kunkeei TaxID=148814 RepID=A0A1L8CI03_9LACO|nr:polyphosphate kinase 1 [Apilactobacillus kunkeei]GAT90812.1 polyphosphate kinase [Apilactobacillus kunkeei]
MGIKSKYKGDLYNRDLSWLLFNRRVIELANNYNVPYLNKLNFLSIASSNLDEFYSVRVPSIKSQKALTNDGHDTKTMLRYSEILKKLHDINNTNFRIQSNYFKFLIKRLPDLGIGNFVKYDELCDRMKQKADQKFDEKILPFLTSTTFNSEYNLDFMKNKWMAIATLVKVKNDTSIRIMPIPPYIRRTVSLKVDGKKQYLMMEDLIINNLGNLYDDGEIKDVIVFRLSRDLDASIDLEKNNGSKKTIQNLRHYLANREKGKITMLEIQVLPDTNEKFINTFIKKFKIEPNDVFKIDIPLDLTFMFPLIKSWIKKHPELAYPSFTGEKWNHKETMQDYLKNKDLLLQYPYDSFDQFIQFLKEAVDNPKTIAIKQTIYRVADNSEVIELLKEASRKGIKVTVVVELRARFDETNNLKVTDELEDAGCEIIFGKKYMKVHSKACLIIMSDKSSVQGYVQIGTGNYNEQTAKGFVDLSLYSSSDVYVNCLKSFFDYLAQNGDCSRSPKYNSIVSSPNRIEDMVIQNINLVKEYYQKYGKGKVFLKVNSLTDIDVISAIYDAAKVGVPFRLVIRGSCCLKLGICGEKENIIISSIVGEFLEHSRIYAFYTDKPSFWISSADLMTRNMVNRVELAAKIMDKYNINKIQKIIDIYSEDDVDGFFLDKEGNYFKYENSKNRSAQQTFIQKSIKSSRKNSNRNIFYKTITEKISELMNHLMSKNKDAQ